MYTVTCVTSVALSRTTYPLSLIATHCNALHHTTPHRTVARCNTLQHSATLCNTHTLTLSGELFQPVQCHVCLSLSFHLPTFPHCNTLHCTATHCNTHPRTLTGGIIQHVQRHFRRRQTRVHQNVEHRWQKAGATRSAKHILKHAQQHTFCNTICNTHSSVDIYTYMYIQLRLHQNKEHRWHQAGASHCATYILQHSLQHAFCNKYKYTYIGKRECTMI